jgi:hypothetical protein
MNEPRYYKGRVNGKNYHLCLYIDESHEFFDLCKTMDSTLTEIEYSEIENNSTINIVKEIDGKLDIKGELKNG